MVFKCSHSKSSMNLLFETILINASLMGLEVNFQLLFSLDGNLFFLLVFHSQPRVRVFFFVFYSFEI